MLALATPNGPDQLDGSLSAHDVVGELTKLTFARIRVGLRATAAITLPANPGSTLRGGFGAALKSSVCTVPDGNCRRCLLRTQCAYSYLFETPIEPGSRRLASAAHAPHPLLIDAVDPTTRRYESGDSFQIDFTFFGAAAITRVPYVVHAMQRLGATGGFGRRSSSGQTDQFVVSDVAQILGSGTLTSLFDERERSLASPRLETIEDLVDTGFTPSQAVRIDFTTPTRLMFDGAPVEKPQFHLLIRNLLRRVSNLVFFHCDAELALPFRDLIDLARQVALTEDATEWSAWERYSRRQRKRLPMAGLVGSVAYTGDLVPFWPLLVLGQVTRTGKHTAFGLGRYRAESIEGAE